MIQKYLDFDFANKLVYHLGGFLLGLRLHTGFIDDFHGKNKTCFNMPELAESFTSQDRRNQIYHCQEISEIKNHSVKVV